MASTFYGEGGILSLNIQMKPLKLLITSIIISISKLILIFLILTILGLWAISYKFFILLIFGGFFLGTFAFYFLKEETYKLIVLIKELKTYG